MPIALLNRVTLKKLANSKLKEARVLLANKLWTGAYYATGLAVECALKACLARAVKKHDFPDKTFVHKMYQHDLDSLFKLDASLWAALEADLKVDQQLNVNWSTVKDWDDEKRYSIVEELDAKSLYEATTKGSGVMAWIRKRW